MVLKIIFLLLIIISISFSEEEANIIRITNQLGDEAIFYGDIINFSINCGNVENLKLIRNDNSILFLPNKTQFQLKPEEYRSKIFNLSFYCGEKNYNIRINLLSLDFEILSIENNYSSEFTSIIFLFKINENIPNISREDISFSYSNNFTLELIRNNFFNLTFEARGESNTLEKIKVCLKDNNYSRCFEKQFYLKISDPLNVKLEYLDTIYKPGSNVTLKMEVYYKNSRVDIENLKINLDSEFVVYPCSDKICIDILKLEESKCTKLNLIVFGRDYSKDLCIKIGKYGFLSLHDLENKPISGYLEIDGKGYAFSGNLTFLFLPGTKNFFLRIGNLEIYFYNTTIEEFNDEIKVYPLKIDEYRFLYAFKFETSLISDKIIAKIYYNEREVKREDRINVVFCENFFVSELKCNSWKEKKFESNFIRNVLEFQISNSEVFAVYEKKDLKIDYTLNKEFYNFEDAIIIKGIIYDEEYKKIDTNLKIKFLEETKEVKTKNGYFEISFKAPKKEGNFSILIDVDNFFYTRLLKEIPVSIKPKVELKLLNQKIINYDNFVEIEIENSGQISLKNLRVFVSEGIVKPDKIEKIDVNEKVTLKIFNIKNDTNPKIIKLEIYEENNKFSFEIPVYFKFFSNNETLEKITGSFLEVKFDLDYTKILLILILLFAIIFLIFYRKNEESKLIGKTALKRIINKSIRKTS